MLCDNLEGWDGGGGMEVPEGGDICALMLIHIAVWIKPTQHCKTIILQLKIKNEGKNKIKFDKK